MKSAGAAARDVKARARSKEGGVHNYGIRQMENDVRLQTLQLAQLSEGLHYCRILLTL